MPVWPGITQDLGSARLVFAIRIAIDEEQADRLAPLLQQRRRRRTNLVRIDRCRDLAACQRALSNLETALPFDHRRVLAPQAPGGRPVAAAHFQHIAETRRGDDAGLGALAFKQGIGRHCRAMDDRRDSAKIVGRGLDAAKEACRLVAAGRGHLCDTHFAGVFVKRQNIGKCAADIDADHDGFAHDPAPLPADVTYPCAASCAFCSLVRDAGSP